MDRTTFFEKHQEAEISDQEIRMLTGPLSVLQQSVTNRTQVLINCRNNKKLVGHVKAYDRHMNVLLENVHELWVDEARKGKGKKTNVSRDRYIQKMFLRGDSIVLVLCNPVPK